MASNFVAIKKQLTIDVNERLYRPNLYSRSYHFEQEVDKMPGSLIKKGEGKWELRVSLGYDKATKKQIRKTKLVHCDKEKDAQKLLAEFYLEVTNCTPTNQRVRFSEFINYYNKHHEARS